MLLDQMLMQETVNYDANRFTDRFSSHSKVNKKSETIVTSQIKLNFGFGGLSLRVLEKRAETLSFCPTNTP